jgi:chemotaxis protein MotA
MFAAIGIVVVASAVIGGFLMEEGNLYVLIQPAELLIIFGAALGSFLIASPSKIVSLVLKNIGTVFSGGGTSKKAYLELLTLLNVLLSKIRKEGLVSIEADIENPDKSALFGKYKTVSANGSLLEFICDNLKVIITANMPPHELDNLIDIDIDAQHSEELTPSRSIEKVADALPGLGIVAAVLGVVLTMGKIDQPPAVLGHSIGAALVGTFLGVLMLRVCRPHGHEP